MKAEPSGTTKYVFKSLHVHLVIHMSALKALVWTETTIKLLRLGAVGSAFDF